MLAGALLLTPPTHQKHADGEEESHIVHNHEGTTGEGNNAGAGNKNPFKILMDCSIMKLHFVLYLICIVSIFLY